MKENQIIASKKWSWCFYVGFCLLLTAMFLGCDYNSTPSTTQDTYLPEAVADLSPPIDLPDSRVTDFDSLREILLEVILPSPDERKLEIWYGKRAQWVPQIGSAANLQAYIEHIYKEQVRNGERGAAAITKLAKGRFYYLDAKYPEAIDQFHESLEISTAIKDSSVIGWTYISLTSSVLQLKENEEAEDYILKAEEIANAIDSEPLRVVSELVKSGVHIHTNRFKTAELALKGVIQRSRELKMGEIEKIGLLNLAYYHIVTGDLDQAIGLLTTNSILTEGEISMVSAIRSLNLYEAYVGKKDYERAYAYLLEGAEQAEILDFGYGKLFCKQSVAQHHERRGEHELALKAFKEYHLIHEEQTGERARNELQELKAEKEFQDNVLEVERLTRAEEESAQSYRNRKNTLLVIIIGLVFAFLFSYLLLKYKTRENIANQNKTIAETRLQVLQSQINPHFIFNALAGIQNSILKSETMDAYNYLGKFSDILRVMATTATSISIPLEQEVDLINNYLALEKLRFRDGFTYSVDVSPELVDTKYKVPGMLVQPVVENAIVHGVSNLTYQGDIQVFFQRFGEGVRVVVSDNGRGRKAGGIIAEKEKGKHLSIATENASNTLKALRAMGYKDADINTLDLFHEDGRPVGTQVTIYLPFLTLKKTS